MQRALYETVGQLRFDFVLQIVYCNVCGVCLPDAKSNRTSRTRPDLHTSQITISKETRAERLVESVS